MKGILEQNTVLGECKRKRERKENPNFKSEPSIYSVFWLMAEGAILKQNYVKRVWNYLVWMLISTLLVLAL